MSKEAAQHQTDAAHHHEQAAHHHKEAARHHHEGNREKAASPCPRGAWTRHPRNESWQRGRQGPTLSLTLRNSRLLAFAAVRRAA